MEFSLRAEGLTVGYNGRPWIRDISFTLRPGEILVLVGPNGSGKSTMLRSIIRQLPSLGGTVCLGGEDMALMTGARIAKNMSILMTDRVRPERMTCYDVAATGRYPYTGRMGILSPEDHRIVEEALERVHGEGLREQLFDRVSDGERQRVLLARALCQEPKVMVLDEPTAYLDIRYKMELLGILQELAREKGIAVIASLHEIDLAAKLADRLLCVGGRRIVAYGPPEQILTGDSVDRLYQLPEGSWEPLYGGAELPKPAGAPEVFVVGGCGLGIPCYRALQKRNVPFAAGILMENDLDYPVAKALAQTVVSVPPFCPMGEADFRRALEILRQCGGVLDAGAPVGPCNRENGALLAEAVRLGKRVWHGWKEWKTEQ